MQDPYDYEIQVNPGYGKKRFSRQELLDILMSVIVLAVAFVILRRGLATSQYFVDNFGDSGAWFVLFGICLILVVVSFLLHEFGHKFVAQKACEFLGMDISNSRIVTCHLGNGGSVTAVLNGKSVDTSMGFTPVEGVVMGTRCGNIDAGVVTYIQEKEHLDVSGITSFLNKKSGFLGVSGVSSDCRDIVNARDGGNYRAGLALNMFFHSVRKYIGAYSAVMGGLDVIVFTGGIGENDAEAREEICRTLGYLGVEFDSAANDGVRGEDKLLSKPTSKVKVLTLTTNEELVIARDTMHLVRG